MWDPTDPVGGSLDAFDPRRALGAGFAPETGGCEPFVPINVPIRASSVFLASHIAYLRRLSGGTQVLARWVGDWLLGNADARGLIDQMAASGTLVGPMGLEADPPDSQASRSDAASKRRGRISLGITLLVVIPILLAGWVEIGGFLREDAPGHMPAWLVAIVSWLVAPFVWLHDIVERNLPLPTWPKQLVAAGAVSLALVAIAGPIGRWLTPLDPRDSRSSGRAGSIFMDDLRRIGAALGIGPK